MSPLPRLPDGGASLARAELQEALPILARRLPDLHLDGPVEWKPPTVGIWGPIRLPLAFRPDVIEDRSPTMPA